MYCAVAKFGPLMASLTKELMEEISSCAVAASGVETVISGVEELASAAALVEFAAELLAFCVGCCDAVGSFALGLLHPHSWMQIKAIATAKLEVCLKW